MNEAVVLGIFIAGVTHNREKWESISTPKSRDALNYDSALLEQNVPHLVEMLTHLCFD